MLAWQPSCPARMHLLTFLMEFLGICMYKRQRLACQTGVCVNEDESGMQLLLLIALACMQVNVDDHVLTVGHPSASHLLSSILTCWACTMMGHEALTVSSCVPAHQVSLVFFIIMADTI